MEPKRLGDAELEIMLVLWQAKEPVTSHYVLEHLREKRSWALSPLMTALSSPVQSVPVSAAWRLDLLQNQPTGESLPVPETGKWAPTLWKVIGLVWLAGCSGEWHILLGHRETADTLTVYALTKFGSYGFQNGNFVEISGNGAIPAVFTFTHFHRGLLCTGVDYPLDGSYYERSIKQMFPFVYRFRAMSVLSYYSDLRTQAQAYAAAYLEKIGRKAVIGDYGGFDHPLLTGVQRS